jgi:hypothetical protein
MFKPRKEEPANSSSAGKITMPEESGMPKSSVIKAQMEEANKKRGSTVEQSWTTSKPDQKFLLMCKWEAGAPNPVWTLYEENSEESKMHFSQAFDSSDFSMMYDVICMTVPSDTSIAAIPDALKPSDKPGRGSSEGPKPASHSPSPAPYPASPSYGSNAGVGGFAAAPTPGFAPAPPPPPPSPYPSYPQNYPPQQPQPAPYQQQPAPYNPAPANQGSPWQQGYAPPPAPPQNAPYAPSQPTSTGSFSAQIDPGIEKSSLNSTYSDLMHKQANVLLGTLLFESELINQNTLDAALKVQELVRESQMSPAQASDVLKRHHMMGASIADYLTPEDFDLGKKPSSKSQGGAAKAGASSEKGQLQQSAFDILQKAGLLKEEDLKTATAVRNKHGGDMPSILQAAGKLDSTTYLAAETCIPLIKKGAMKIEQCIIALNYCNRSRVDFDSALEELGWENPRKAAK